MKAILFIAIVFLVGNTGDLPKSIERKINKTISRSFNSDAVTLEKLLVDEVTGGLGTFIYALAKESKQLGYIVITSAMGRHEYFDYCVIYNIDHTIRHVEVLVYRSDHGFEITNKRWLKQFIGKNGCGLEYNKDIDAISGATYSASSLAMDLGRLCLFFQTH